MCKVRVITRYRLHYISHIPNFLLFLECLENYSLYAYPIQLI